MKEIRPWGSYVVLGQGKGFLVKLLVVSPGQRFSLQYHVKRREYWVIVDGVAKITYGDGDLYSLIRGCTSRIEIGMKHRIENTGESNLILIEVQIGDVDESDIVRLEDDYGRV